jgi:hypothetical protein
MTTRAVPPITLAGLRLGTMNRAGVLLLILVFTYLLSAFTKGVLISVFQILLFLAVVLIALRSGQLSPHATRIAIIIVLAGSLVAAVLLLVDTNGPGAGVANIWTGLILLLAAVLIVRRVLARPEITLQSIYGALSAYLILGLMYASFYAAMYRFGGNTFFANHQPGDTRTFQYFSFVTLTTTGYGDFTAAGNGGRAVAVLEAITGQIFLATLVARLVAGFRTPARKASERPQHGPAGARRAQTRRAGASGLTRGGPPGTARRRTSTARPGARPVAGPDGSSGPGGPEPASGQASSPG